MIRIKLAVVLTIGYCAFAVLATPSAQPQELSKRDPAVERSLRRLHDILRQRPQRSDAERHDAYLAFITVGNEETVSLLVERLRQDYGESEPTPVDLAKVGFVCTHVHLIDALRSITNTDQGMFYPRWAKWWAANRANTRLKWVLDGFAEGGMHATEPPDERFGLELIEALAGKRAYYAMNARRLLIRVPPRVRSGWVISAATSDRRSFRLGALKDLEQIDTATHDDTIRKLSGDADEEIRNLAADILKTRREMKH